MNFIQTIFGHLHANPTKPVIVEVYGERLEPTDGERILGLVSRARGALRQRGFKPGERAVLLAPNSARWVATDLALLAEGAIVVPMYARQNPTELAEMMHDCDPSVVICVDAVLASKVTAAWPDAPIVTFEQLFTGPPVDDEPVERTSQDPVTIVYTSGSTGAPKGVVTTVANADYMLPQTATGLTRMMRLGGAISGDDVVFHYLPFCFAGSRIVLWTCLYRNNSVHISTDLDNMATEFGAVKPHYFLNVPVLLERIKNGVEAGIRKKPRPLRWLYRSARAAYLRKIDGNASLKDRVVLRLARRVLFSAIKERIGPRLRCLICGSAPLGEHTQRWFEMLGIPVYQVYGLTETTAIVTMDTPAERVVPGRVGPALDGVHVRVGDNLEMQVRGPNVFSKYWNKPQETSDAFTHDGWFRTGDQGEVDQHGNWQIIGRVKNLIIPTSGHNIAPEPIEQLLIENIESIEQAMLVGHGKAFVAVILTGDADADAVQKGIDAVNVDLPHYRRVRSFHLASEPFTIENELLTANQKMRRSAIEDHYHDIIEAFYAS
ncbi:MAG: long-chain acyl-CoA synthetase [Kiritimatiellia bacterium]|jgi:long-chain acyl-CoA synthetase